MTTEAAPVVTRGPVYRNARTPGICPARASAEDSHTSGPIPAFSRSAHGAAHWAPPPIAKVASHRGLVAHRRGASTPGGVTPSAG